MAFESDEILGSEEDNPGIGFDHKDRLQMAKSIILGDSKWKEPKRPLSFSTFKWRPDLIRGDGAVCHIHAISEFHAYIIQRIETAYKKNRDVFVAAPLDSWYSNETLLLLSKYDVKPIRLKPTKGKTPPQWVSKQYRSIADLIALENLRLNPEAFKDMGYTMLDRALTARTTYERGWRFEDFLCLLFSQVSYFEIHQHNFRNKTAEIDIVINNLRLPGTNLPSSPIILCSAKNEKGSVDVSALSSLHDKMGNTRGMCRLGFLCASRKFAYTVPIQNVGYRHDDKVIITLDGSTLRHLLDSAETLDKEIQNLFIKATLA